MALCHPQELPPLAMRGCTTRVVVASHPTRDLKARHPPPPPQLLLRRSDDEGDPLLSWAALPAPPKTAAQTQPRKTFRRRPGAAAPVAAPQRSPWTTVTGFSCLLLTHTLSWAPRRDADPPQTRMWVMAAPACSRAPHLRRMPHRTGPTPSPHNLSCRRPLPTPAATLIFQHLSRHPPLPNAPCLAASTASIRRPA